MCPVYWCFTIEKLNFQFIDAINDEPDFIVNNFGFEITSSRFSDESNKVNSVSQEDYSEVVAGFS